VPQQEVAQVSETVSGAETENKCAGGQGVILPNLHHNTMHLPASRHHPQTFKRQEPSMNTHSRPIGTSHPGLIMILLDQSSSMAANQKAMMASTAVNRVIYEIMLASRAGEIIKDRCYVGVIGYGATIRPLVAGQISDVNAKPLRSETFHQMKPDGAGGLVSTPMVMPIWVEPVMDNGTPMARAMDQAFSLVEQWIKDHRDSFPPIVINVTDGEPDDFDLRTGQAPTTTAAAKRLMELKTDDGNLLLFNAHITGQSTALGISLPSTDTGLLDAYAKLLFNISSVLPPRFIDEAYKVGLSPQVGARGLVFQGNEDSLIRFLTFGSSVVR
jgi:hypothetical protein